MFPYKTNLMGWFEQLILHSHYFTTPNLSTYFELVLALNEHQYSLGFTKQPCRTFQSTPGSAHREAQVSHGAVPHLCPCRGEQWVAGDSVFSWAQSTRPRHKVSPTKIPGCICTAAGTGVAWMFPFRNSSIKPNAFKTRVYYNPLQQGKQMLGYF